MRRAGLVLPASTWALCLAATAAARFPQDPPQGEFESIWHVVSLAGQRTGVMHLRRERTGDIIETTQVAHFKLKRAGATVEIRTRRVDVETVSGEANGFRTEQDFGGQRVVQTGTIRNGKLRVVTQQGDASTETEHDWDPRGRLAWGAFVQQRQAGLRDGTTLTTYEFNPEVSLATPAEVVRTIAGRERVATPALTADAVRAAVVMRLPGGGELRSEEWYDENLRPLRMRFDMLGQPFEATLTTRDDAGKEIDAAEVFVGALLPAGRAIDAEKARRVVLRLTTRDDMPLELPTTPMQSVRKLPGGRYEVTVTRLDHAALRDARVTTDSAEARACLRATVFANSDDQQVRAMADEALRGLPADKPLALVDALRRHVTTEVREKTLSVAFGTAGDVARSRAGDCSEHAVLLAAMCRARGIPARGVLGLVYVPRFAARDNVFGFHMWTQVLLDGQWVDVDAALRQTDVDPTHLALATTILDEADFGAAALLPFMHALSTLKLEVVSVD